MTLFANIQGALCSFKEKPQSSFTVGKGVEVFNLPECLEVRISPTREVTVLPEDNARFSFVEWATEWGNSVAVCLRVTEDKEGQVSVEIETAESHKKAKYTHLKEIAREVYKHFRKTRDYLSRFYSSVVISEVQRFLTSGSCMAPDSKLRVMVIETSKVDIREVARPGVVILEKVSREAIDHMDFTKSLCELLEKQLEKVFFIALAQRCESDIELFQDPEEFKKRLANSERVLQAHSARLHKKVGFHRL